MNDELDALRGSPALTDLLTHYARLAGPDRQAWQARKGPDEGVEPRRMSRLHGELMAWGWLEQNTGELTPGSYRVTRAGMSALSRLESGGEEE